MRNQSTGKFKCDICDLGAVLFFWARSGMATTRVVILHFVDRQKAISIPEVSTPDVEFLKGAFQQWTGESAEPHFQHFDKEWEEWLEMDEDSKLGNRERIQVVLSSARTTNEPVLVSM